MEISLLISYILGFTILFGYILYIILKDKRIPYSISDTVYSLDKQHKVMFSVTMAIVGILISPNLFEIMSMTNYTILSFVTILGVFGVASDPLVYNEKNIIHYASAILMGISSQLIVYMLQPWLMTLWIPYLLYTMYMDDGRWNMMFAEMVMMIALLICGLI